MDLREVFDSILAGETTRLHLPNKTIGDSEMQEISEFLIENGSLITEITLDDNVFGSSGATALAEALPFCPALQTLSLKECDLGRFSNWGGIAIFRALQNHPTLHELRVDETGLGNYLADEIANLLKSSCPLKHLTLGDWNGIDDKGAISIINACKTNTRLENLGMSGNGLTQQTYLALAEMFKTNRTLTSFKISYGTRNPATLEILTNAVLTNKNLVRCLFSASETIEGLPSAVRKHLEANRTMANEYASFYWEDQLPSAEQLQDIIERSAAVSSQIRAIYGCSPEETQEIFVGWISKGEALTIEHLPLLLPTFGVKQAMAALTKHDVPFSAEDLTSDASLEVLEKSGWNMMEMFSSGIEFQTSAQLNRCLAKISHEQRAEIPGLHVLKARLQKSKIVEAPAK